MQAHLLLYCFQLCLLISITLLSQPSESSFSVMTYNIRLDYAGDGIDNWHHRKAALAQFVETKAPDILGIQEGLKNQVDYLDSTLYSYCSIGVGRDDGISAGEHMSIYYRHDKVRLLDWQTFWLSPTPELVSKGWDAACYRTCTIVDFVIDKDTITILNTHFDHQGETARLNSTKVIQGLISKQKYPVILMGDFNLTPTTELYTMITKYIADANNSEAGTYNGFAFHPDTERRIDYIFYDKEHYSRLTYQVLHPTVHKRQLSDHYPVIARFAVLE